MELYNFLRGALMWSASVAALWPANVPLMALAYRIRQGDQPMDLEPPELWTRSTVAALSVAVLTVVAVGLDYGLAAGAELPAGPVHLVIFLAYVGAAAWLLFMMFALDDYFGGLSILGAYLFLPVVVLFLVNALFGWWQPVLNFVGGYLRVAS